MLEAPAEYLFRVPVSMSIYNQVVLDKCSGLTKGHMEVVAYVKLGSRRGGKSCLSQQE